MPAAEPVPATEALALLPLPDLASLSEQQRRGALCVWDSEPLGPDAIDLGQRRADDGRTVFPRACRPCMRAHVRGSVAAHTAMCNHCVAAADARDEAEVCDTAKALHRLVLEHVR